VAAKKTDDDRSLKRLGGGRWQTRDERFTIEPQSGTWVLVDAEQADDLGLPLVRGPFRSLTEAKAAVESARGTAPPESPLADRVKEAGTRPPKRDAAKPGAATPPEKSGRAEPAKTAKPVEPEAPPEPRWLRELGSPDRGRARRLIEQLGDAGVRDAESVVRQDLTGGVPTVTRLALADQLAELLETDDESAPAIERAAGRLVEAIVAGRDEELAVRWRLVDDENRPIGLTAADLGAAIKRRTDAAGKEKDR
jgi:hypothetical protein